MAKMYCKQKWICANSFQKKNGIRFICKSFFTVENIAPHEAAMGPYVKFAQLCSPKGGPACRPKNNGSDLTRAAALAHS
jgi:hypothetical protein